MAFRLAEITARRQQFIGNLFWKAKKLTMHFIKMPLWLFGTFLRHRSRGTARRLLVKSGTDFGAKNSDVST